MRGGSDEMFLPLLKVLRGTELHNWRIFRPVNICARRWSAAIAAYVLSNVRSKENAW